MDRAVRLTTVVTYEDDWHVARALEVEVASQGGTVEGRAQAVHEMSHDEEPSAGVSPEELARFYDEHDLTALDPGERVETRAVRKPMVSRSVRFDRETMRRLRAVAARRGLGVTQLMREWIVDRLEAEETGRHRSDIATELERLARELRASA